MIEVVKVKSENKNKFRSTSMIGIMTSSPQLNKEDIIYILILNWLSDYTESLSIRKCIICI